MFNDIKEFLRSIRTKLSSKKFAKRYSWVIIISILTLLIPLSIALCHLKFTEMEKNAASPKISVSLFAPNGDVLYSDETTEKHLKSSYLSKLLFDLSTTKVKAVKPTEFAKTPSIGFSISYGSESSTYKCYFEENISKSYFEDQNGDFYVPSHEAYSSFLNSHYAELVYRESAPPSLHTNIDEVVLPLSTEWTYSLINGNEAPSKIITTTEDILSYRITGAISFGFSRAPDVCDIEIKKPDGTLVFSGGPSDLSSITANEGDELLIKMNAEWNQTSIFTSHGYQSYEFKVICSEPSSFSLSASSVSGGQLILISANNLTADDSVTYSVNSNSSFTLPETNVSLSKEEKALAELYSYKPIFVKEGSNAYAFLPIPANIPDTVFKFSLSCGITKNNFSLNIKKSVQSDVTVEDPLNKIAITSAQKAEFTRILLSLKHSDNDTLLAYGEFLSPTSYGFTQSYNYNTQVNNSFAFLSSTFSAPSNIEENVKSIGIGTVTFTGNSPLLGNYVIIDHGMGLLSWYCGLSIVNVDVGDIVKPGDPIGLSGSSSLLCNNGVNILCTVGGILIDPNQILGKSLISR